ncbi:hypothetical protein BDV32DRAFT_144262 [Aspergillus pseudonomiae]|nr:hypothetical protein BDV32DRAFT_144262 [Aspergillus pseudonomiae]
MIRILLLLAFIFQGSEALPIGVAKPAPSTTIIGAALGIGLVVLVPTLVWVGMITRRHIRRWRFNRKRAAWRHQMAQDIRAMRAAEEASIVKIPRFAVGQTVTQPERCVVRDSPPPASPATSLHTIPEDDGC